MGSEKKTREKKNIKKATSILKMKNMKNYQLIKNFYIQCTTEILEMTIKYHFIKKSTEVTNKERMRKTMRGCTGISTKFSDPWEVGKMATDICTLYFLYIQL